MKFEDCIKFASSNPVCFVGTVEGDQPRVRAFLVFCVNENGFFFTTGSKKNVYRQLQENPKLELCFYCQESGKQMRVTGEAAWVEDLEFRAKVLEGRPWLRSLGFGSPEDPGLAVLKVAHGDVHFWVMADNLQEDTIEHLKF